MTPVLTTMPTGRLVLRPEASVTVTVTVDVPAGVGVPLTSPAAETRRPAGAMPELPVQVSGRVPPMAWSCAWYLRPRVPIGSRAVEIAGAGVEGGGVGPVTGPATVTVKALLVPAAT